MLNNEEKYQQKQFEREQFARPTDDQLEIANLVEQLKLSRSTNEHLNNTLDAKIELLDLVNGECKKLRLVQQNEHQFAENVLKILGWVL